MIAYNPKEWFSQIMRFHKADTVRKLAPTMSILAVITAIVVAIETHLFHISGDSQLAKTSVMYSILGFVISLLLVFRTNTAYERWWDGRKLWGALTNCSRNLAVKIHAIVQNEDDQKHLLQLVIHFPYALKNHLRNAATMNESELAELFHITELKNKKHLPLQISNAFYHKAIELNRSGAINAEQLLIINQEAQQWMEICGLIQSPYGKTHC